VEAVIHAYKKEKMRVKLSLIKTVQLEVAMNRYTVLEQQDGEYARILVKGGEADALFQIR